MIDAFASQALTRLVNRLLSRDPAGRARLAPYAGRWACFDLPGVAIDAMVQPDGLLAPAGSGEAGIADVKITLAASALPALLGGGGELLRAVRIEGDADFAQVLASTLRALPLDPEEELAPWIGDIAAVRVVAALRSGLNAAAAAGSQLGRSAADYLSGERALLADRTAFERGREALVQLTDRIAQLERRLDAGAGTARGVARRGTA